MWYSQQVSTFQACTFRACEWCCGTPAETSVEEESDWGNGTFGRLPGRRVAPNLKPNKKRKPKQGQTRTPRRLSRSRSPRRSLADLRSFQIMLRWSLTRSCWVSSCKSSRSPAPCHLMNSSPTWTRRNQPWAVAMWHSMFTGQRALRQSASCPLDLLTLMRPTFSSRTALGTLAWRLPSWHLCWWWLGSGLVIGIRMALEVSFFGDALLSSSSSDSNI